MTQSLRHPSASTISSLHHHACPWCRQDLGPLQHPSAYDLFAIRPACTRTYFATLYLDDGTSLPLLLEKRIARSIQQRPGSGLGIHPSHK